ncbi:thioredoxin-disulfide reductase [Candidatus Bathyarchaeota archaeon]|nr:thioredoxin-disulfide reductase [Candidatus Bathyarchaeota archaeon]
MENWDLIIIGAGPAGLAAGIYGTRSGLETLVLDEKIAGGTAADAPIIQNYLGFSSILGLELAQKMADHAKNAGVKIREFEEATQIDLKPKTMIVRSSKTIYETKTIIIATGGQYRQLGVPGETHFRGRGVSYCGLCDGPLFKGKQLLVVGGGNSALITALYLADIASKVKIAHRKDAFRGEEALIRTLKEKQNIETLLNTEVKEIKGDRLVNSVVLFNNATGETRETLIDGVFVQVGEDPNSRLAKEAGVAVDEDGYIVVDVKQRTNVNGVFAAGDVTNHPVKQVGTAVGQGTTAATEAYGYVRRPYYKQ